MAMFAEAMPFHDGEEEMHKLMHVDVHGNPTVSALSMQLAVMLQRAPLLAVGCLDKDGNPWSTLWGGQKGFAASLGGNMMGVRTAVDGKYDPVVETLLGGDERPDGEVVREEGKGRMVGGLAIDLEARKRVKLYGRLVAGAISRSLPTEQSTREDQQQNDVSSANTPSTDDAATGEVQLVVHIEQSLGNCPKYLNKYSISPATPSPTLLSSSKQLTQEGLDLIERNDLFFITSSRADQDMDTNHRGGPRGFVRVFSNKESGAEIVYPEYSGNRLYQTLGNLQVTSKAGLVFPDLETGNVLYVTGTTQILIGKEASDIIPHSNLAVKVKVTAARLVQSGLPLRGQPGETSPYNPNVRLLASEGNIAAKFGGPRNTAKLIGKERITATIWRYRFAITNPKRYGAGQWVALDFSHELDIGYSHMRDDDPSSLNDDFVRTFTISSTPKSASGPDDEEFEITVRLHGPVTAFLMSRQATMDLEVPILGFGGDFKIQAASVKDAIIPMVAGGVGITPLLGQLSAIDVERLRLFWTLRLGDIGFAKDTFDRYPGLAACTSLFITASGEGKPSEETTDAQEQLEDAGATVHSRRLKKEDLDAVPSETWHICAATPLQKQLLEWLQGRTVHYESFDY